MMDHRAAMHFTETAAQNGLVAMKMVPRTSAQTFNHSNTTVGSVVDTVAVIAVVSEAAMAIEAATKTIEAAMVTEAATKIIEVAVLEAVAVVDLAVAGI